MTAEQLQLFTQMAQTYSLFGIPAVWLVILGVRVAREIGLPAKYAQAVAFLLGLLLGIAIAFYGGFDYVQGAVIGLVLGGAAIISYDSGKLSTTTTKVPDNVEDPDDELLAEEVPVAATPTANSVIQERLEQIANS